MFAFKACMGVMDPGDRAGSTVTLIRLDECGGISGRPVRTGDAAILGLNLKHFYDCIEDLGGLCHAPSSDLAAAQPPGTWLNELHSIRL